MRSRETTAAAVVLRALQRRAEVDMSQRLIQLEAHGFLAVRARRLRLHETDFDELVAKHVAPVLQTIGPAVTTKALAGLAADLRTHAAATVVTLTSAAGADSIHRCARQLAYRKRVCPAHISSWVLPT